jgi:hypothetical protein
MTSPRVRRDQGKRLRDARIAAGFRSARDAALSSDWPESTYRSHESGTRTIGLDDAERYARRFRAAGASITAQMILFGNDDEPQPAAPHKSGAAAKSENSQPTKEKAGSVLSVELLERSIKLVEDWLRANQRTMSPRKKAETVSLIYTMVAERIESGQSELDMRRVHQILRLVG